MLTHRQHFFFLSFHIFPFFIEMAMALRLASRRADKAFNGCARVAIIESRVHGRNASAMADPTSALPDEIRNEISVGFEAEFDPRNLNC